MKRSGDRQLGGAEKYRNNSAYIGMHLLTDWGTEDEIIVNMGGSMKNDRIGCELYMSWRERCRNFIADFRKSRWGAAPGRHRPRCQLQEEANV